MGSFASSSVGFGGQGLPVRRFFFIRHAQSAGNVRGVFHSNTADWALTDLGHAQAQRAAGPLATLPIQAVLSSPLTRVQDTIAPYLSAQDRNGRPLAHTRDPRLIERDFAGVEGLPIPLDRNFFIEDPDGVEPTHAFITRLFAGLRAGLQQEDTLFAAHAGVMHGLMLGLGLDLDPWAGPYNNATPTIIEQTPQGWRLQYWDFDTNTWKIPPPATRDWTR